MKNIIYGAGVVTILTTLVFTLLGKVELKDAVLIDTSILGLFYALLERFERKQVEADHTVTLMQLEDKDSDYKKLLSESRFLQSTTNSLYEENVMLTEKLKASTEILPSLTKLVEDAVVEKPVKKTRSKKVNK